MHQIWKLITYPDVAVDDAAAVPVVLEASEDSEVVLAEVEPEVEETAILIRTVYEKEVE